MNENKKEYLNESVYFTFYRGEYNWNEISQLSYEQCLEKEEALPLSELETIYNDYDTDCKDTENYIRIFPKQDAFYAVYMLMSDGDEAIELDNGTQYTLGNAWLTKDNEEEDIFFSEIPTDILEELYSRSSLIEKSNLIDFEHRFATEDFPLHITIREMADYDEYDMNEESSFIPDYETIDEDGTIKIYKNLYNDFENSGLHITAFLSGDSIKIIKRSLSMDGMIEFISVLDDIPANSLMKSLNATDYYEMMNILKEKYNDEIKFNEIISLLHKNNIPHRTKHDSCNWAD